MPDARTFEFRSAVAIRTGGDPYGDSHQKKLPNEANLHIVLIPIPVNTYDITTGLFENPNEANLHAFFIIQPPQTRSTVISGVVAHTAPDSCTTLSLTFGNAVRIQTIGISPTFEKVKLF
jgi:hypothetical protein